MGCIDVRLQAIAIELEEEFEFAESLLLRGGLDIDRRMAVKCAFIASSSLMCEHFEHAKLQLQCVRHVLHGDATITARMVS